MKGLNTDNRTGTFMEVKTLEINDLSIRFILRGMPIPLANSLRRIMIAEVPTMAIEDVFMIENSSPMDDEVLTHRLGLIPLKTDLDTYVLPEECDCQSELGCSKCSVLLTLDVEASDSVRTVYSGELKSNDPKVIPVSDKIPIVKLAPGQRVQLEASARLGRGKTHAKWQPVSACAYKYLPDQSTDRVVWVKDAVEFFVESTGALKPERIVVEAIKILRNKTDELIKQAFVKGKKRKAKKGKKRKAKK